MMRRFGNRAIVAHPSGFHLHHSVPLITGILPFAPRRQGFLTLLVRLVPDSETADRNGGGRTAGAPGAHCGMAGIPRYLAVFERIRESRRQRIHWTAATTP